LTTQDNKMDEQTDKQTDRWTIRWMDGQVHSSIPTTLQECWKEKNRTELEDHTSLYSSPLQYGW